MIIVRELGPIITALIVTLRSATAVTIETGYMSVLHEIDSLEMAGMDPLYVIALPRLLGITTAVLCLFIIFDLVALLGGYALAWSLTELPLENFMAQIAKALTIPDIIQGIVKGVFFGVVITVVSLHRGFTTRTQITQLPISTSKGAIECLFYCVVVSMLVSVAFY
jgi:phospholipid/cholesterol/gamma-HCH transport system permease protein